MHIGNKKKDILVFDKSQTQGLDDSMITAEAKRFINFTRSRRIFFLSQHYYGSNSLLFVSATKLY